MARLNQRRPLGGIFELEDVPVTAHDEVRERLATLAGKRDLQRIPFRPWAMRVPARGGGTLDFDLFPYQREWYDDDIVYRSRGNMMKATQVGASEYAVRWALFWPDTRGDTSFYVFPARSTLYAFSDQRVKGLIQGSSYLKSRVPYGYISNKTLKQIGFGFMQMAGSHSEAELESTPADEVILDEFDLLVQRHIPAAEKRLSSPTSRNLLRRLGWPTYTEVGIDRHYLASDRRQWLVKCSCGAELPLHFYEQDGGTHHYVDVQRVTRACGKCREAISQRQVAAGRWVAEFPERDEFGYQVSGLIVPTLDVAATVAESKLTRPYEVETFWRKRLGLPYDTVEGRLSREAIQAAISAGGNYLQGPWDSGYAGTNPVTCGVDVASVRNLNVRISEHLPDGRRRALFVGELESFDDLYTQLLAFQVGCCCIDHEPEGRLARGVAARLPGIVYLHSWNDRNAQALKFDPQLWKVSTHRTTLIDAVMDDIRQRLNLLPANLPEDYIAHMRAPVKFQEEDPETGLLEVGYKVEQAHDYMQAEAYDLAAWYVLQLVTATSEAAAGEVYALETRLENYRRSGLGSWEDVDYSPGLGQDEYSPGPGSEDGWS